MVVISIVTIPYLTISIIRVSRCNGIKALGIMICSNKVVSTTNLVFGLWNVLSDFYILAIPISQIQGLKMPNKRKIGVLTLFFTGFMYERTTTFIDTVKSVPMLIAFLVRVR